MDCLTYGIYITIYQLYFITWCLWFNRNEVRLGEARQQGSSIVQKACFLLDEFQTTNFKLKPVVDTTETSMV